MMFKAFAWPEPTVKLTQKRIDSKGKRFDDEIRVITSKVSIIRNTVR
jgi:hypothetical protein